MFCGTEEEEWASDKILKILLEALDLVLARCKQVNPLFGGFAA